MKKKSLYHGSKSNFNDFNMSFINTGNELQKYGHGLYFTSSPAVANNYRENTCLSEGSYESFLCRNDYDNFIIDKDNLDDFELVSHIYESDIDTLIEDLDDEDSDIYQNKYFLDNIERFRDFNISYHQGILYEVDLSSDSNILNANESVSTSFAFNVLKSVIPEDKLSLAEEYVLSFYNGSLSEFNDFFESVITMNHEGDILLKIEDCAPDMDLSNLISLIEPYYFEVSVDDYTNMDFYRILSSVLNGDESSSSCLKSVGFSGMYVDNPVSVLSSNKKESEDAYIIWDDSIIYIREKNVSYEYLKEEVFEDEFDLGY